MVLDHIHSDLPVSVLLEVLPAKGELALRDGPETQLFSNLAEALDGLLVPGREDVVQVRQHDALQESLRTSFVEGSTVQVRRGPAFGA